MPETHQVAFAASCCERLYPSYQALTTYLGLEDHKTLRSILDAIWQHVLGRKMIEQDIERLQSTFQELPLGEEGCCIRRKPALEVLDGVWHALEACKAGTATNAAKVAECAINRVDGGIMAEVWELYNRPIGPGDYEAVERQVNCHPAMQAELMKQAGQVEFLEKHNHLNEIEISQLRSC
jgi:hypothetical protein